MKLKIMAGGIAMKYKFFAQICMLTLLSSSMSTLSLGSGAMAVITAYNKKITPTDKITVPAGTDDIVKEMLFGTGDPRVAAKELLHNILITLKDAHHLSDNAQKRLHAIKAILTRCKESGSLIGDWIQLQSIDFNGILSKETLEKIGNEFSVISFMSRL